MTKTIHDIAHKLEMDNMGYHDALMLEYLQELLEAYALEYFGFT